jgi:hypothetical protein
MMRIAAFPFVVLLAALSGCVAPPTRTVDPRPAPRPTMTPPVAAAQPAPIVEGAVSLGIWTYGTDARGTRALFGQANRDASLVIRCDRAARRIYLSVPGVAPGTLTLRATSTVKAVAARPTGSTQAHVAVELDPADPILDALAFSRGRFTIALDTRQTVVPAWPEFTRVVEDCRR